MLQRITATLFCIFQITLGVAQDSISDKTWYKKINQSFGTVATGQGEAVNLANYGSFEPVNGQFKLNVFGPIGSTSKKKAAFFSVNIGGKLLGDNTGVLFNNSKFNTGVKLGGKIHIPFKPKIDVSGNEIDSILAKIRQVQREQDSKIYKARQEFDSVGLSVRYSNDTARMGVMSNQMREHEKTIIRLQGKIKPGLPDEELLLTSDSLLSFRKQLQQLYVDSTALQGKAADTKNLLDRRFDRINGLNRVNNDGKKEFEKKKDSLEMTVIVKGSSFLWLSIVGNLERQKYHTFFDSLPFVSQLAERKFTTHEVGLEFNFIGYSTGERSMITENIPHIHLGNVGLVNIRKNDASDLNTTEMSDSRKHAAGDSAHSLSTKYNVYTQDITSYNGWKLYMNYYYYFGKKRNYALHIFPDVEFRDTKENPVNLGAGLVLGIKNKKDNTVFNVELYGKLVDMGKALKQDEARLINRNEVGLHLGIPFNFPTIK